MTTTASPVDMRRPAIVAAGWPNRRDRRTILTRGSWRRSSRIRSSVASVHGSRLKMIS